LLIIFQIASVQIFVTIVKFDTKSPLEYAKTALFFE